MKFQNFIKEQMKDPEFKKEYEKLEIEFTLKQAIVDLKNSYHVSQKEFSKLTGISQKDIQKIENGDSDITLEVLKRIVKALNADLKIEFIPRS